MVSGQERYDVRLRPLEQADLAIFEDDYASKEGTGEYQWFGFSTQGRGLVEMGEFTRDSGRLTAVVDDRVVGNVMWFRKEYGPAETSWCWELAFHIREPERGKGYGTQCVEIASQYLFEHTRAHRLQAATDTKNVVMQRVLEKCGYILEGTLRAVQWREGAFHDYRMYSLLRAESTASAS